MGILTPSFMDDMSWRMAEVYGAITDQILINLAHYFPLFDESKLPRSSFAYQADMLAQMGQVNRETVAIIRRGLGDADDALKRVLNDAIIKSVQAVNPGLWGAVMRGILSPPKRPILVPEQMRAFNMYYQQAAQKMNLVNTVMLESTKQAYQATVADIANRVANTSLTQCYIYELVADVMHKASFFGFSQEALPTELEKIKQSCEESQESATKGIPFEEALDELGRRYGFFPDWESEDERELHHEVMRAELAYSMHSREKELAAILATLQEELAE